MTGLKDRIRDLKAVSPLSLDEETRLRGLAKDGDQDAWELLLASVIRLVSVKAYKAARSGFLEYDDALAEYLLAFSAAVIGDSGEPLVKQLAIRGHAQISEARAAASSALSVSRRSIARYLEAIKLAGSADAVDATHLKEVRMRASTFTSIHRAIYGNVEMHEDFNAVDTSSFEDDVLAADWVRRMVSNLSPLQQEAVNLRYGLLDGDYRSRSEIEFELCRSETSINKAMNRALAKLTRQAREAV